MKFFLIVAKGKRQGTPIPIEIDLFVIGSGKECQLRAVHDDIGDQHCALVIRERKVFIRDLNSGHATLVNGNVMDPSIEWPVHSGDILEVGPLKFMIQYREKALSQRDLEEWAHSCLDQAETRKVTAMDRIEQAQNYSEEYESAASAATAILDALNAQKGIVKGRLRIARENGITIVRVNDIYLVEDAELALINKELRENLNRPNLRVLIDLKNVKRMSSAAAEMFAELRNWLRPFGSRMAFCRVRNELNHMLHMFPAIKDLPAFDDKQKALTGKW